MTPQRYQQILDYIKPFKPTKYWQNIFRNAVEWADEHPISPWINVKDRLPEKSISPLLNTSDWVIVTREGCSFAFNAFYNYNTKMWMAMGSCGFEEIIAPDYWMPIPKSPKSEE